MKAQQCKNPLNFLLVSMDQLDALMSLRVAGDEKHLIAPVSVWLAEASYLPDAITYGIYEGETPVGLISLIDPRLIDEDDDKSSFQADCLYVWRVMIDHRQRARGYGTAALDFAMNYARCIGLKGLSLTTMDQEVGNALIFYEGLGFAPTGRRIDGEIELVFRNATHA